MNEIDKYLDEVCRALGGSHDLRRHIREELHDHLADAIEANVAKGLSEEDAARKAIEDFGDPTETRQGLQALYGHSTVAFLIDRAMAWKERTMKSEWKWGFLAAAALFVVIAAEVTFIMCIAGFVFPRVEDFYVSYNLSPPPFAPSMPALNMARQLLGPDTEFAWMLAGLFVVAWALFEWRGRSENKALIRLGVGAFVAVALTVAVWVMTIAAIWPLAALPHLIRRQTIQPIVASGVRDAGAAFADLKQAMEARDWRGAGDGLARMSRALSPLYYQQATAATLVAMKRPGETEKVQRLLDELTQKRDDLWQSLYSHPDPVTFAPDARIAAERAPGDFDELSRVWDALCKELQSESTGTSAQPVPATSAR